MRTYLDCTVGTSTTTFKNPLKLSEARLISKWIKDGYTVIVEPAKCTKEEFKRIFG